MSKLTDQCQLGESTPSCLQTSLQMEQQDEPAVRSRMAFAPDLGENAYSGALPLTRLKALIINVLHYRSLVAGAVDERGRSTSSSRPTCLPCSRLSNPLSPNLGSGYTIINIASLDPYAPAPDRLDSTSTSTKKTINIFSNGFTHQHVSYGIHVNVVARSFRWSVLQRSGDMDAEILPKLGSGESPMVKVMQPEEPAHVFLAVAASSFVVRGALNVNGDIVTQ